MWRIREHRQLDKRSRKLPAPVLKKYDLWKNLVFRHGPDVLKTFPGFHDEKLKGERAGQRSSRLSLQYRVIYRVDERELLVYVLDINPHQYEEAHLMKKPQASHFVPAKPRAKMTTGEVIRMLRELKGWTQKELSSRCGISPSNLSQLEHDRLDIGKRRAEQLARAFGIHPAIIMFPEYEGAEIARVA